jgi:hypothetical protein
MKEKVTINARGVIKSVSWIGVGIKDLPYKAKVRFLSGRHWGTGRGACFNSYEIRGLDLFGADYVIRLCEPNLENPGSSSVSEFTIFNQCGFNVRH